MSSVCSRDRNSRSFDVVDWQLKQSYFNIIVNKILVVVVDKITDQQFHFPLQQVHPQLVEPEPVFLGKECFVSLLL